MAREATDPDKSIEGHGPYGQGAYQSHQYFGSPTFGSLEPPDVSVQYAGDHAGESPRQLLEDTSAVTLPFQPQFTYIGSNWYMSFETAGVVFLPIARNDTAHRFHIPWNAAWPFRPVIESSSTIGAPLDGSSRHKFINDVATYSTANGGARKPMLKLENDKNNIIYLEVTYTVEEEAITGHADVSSDASFTGIPAQVPAMKLTGNTGLDGEDDHDHTLANEGASTANEVDNLSPPWQVAGSSTGGNPHVYVPVQEQNYYVETPEPDESDGSYDLSEWNVRVKVASSADGNDATDVFSSKNITWMDDVQIRKFVWGAVVVDDSTPHVITASEWWRYDCPNYDINNHCIGKTTTTSSDDTRDVPVTHETTDNTGTFESFQVPVDGISGTI